MSLVTLWSSDREQILAKRVDQLIAFAGEGKLRDGNETSRDFRDLLRAVPSDLLEAWVQQSLDDRFPDFGFVIQDIVNEIGHRLGFTVVHGVYRGTTGGDGLDGAWQLGNRAIVVESKASTTYSIDLDRIAGYLDQIRGCEREFTVDKSVLIVVGDDETANLEAQVRGSRWAWTMRIIGIRSLVRLLKLKESLNDIGVERQIQEILFPQEFTRLDRIIDLVFATTEDATALDLRDVVEEDDGGEIREAASFHSEVVPRLEAYFRTPLVKQSRVLWSSPDGATLVSCQVSKEYDRDDMHYWFGLKRSTQNVLAEHKNSFCAFGLGSAHVVVLLDYGKIDDALRSCFTSPDKGGGILHWHLRFKRSGERILLLKDRHHTAIDVTANLLK